MTDEELQVAVDAIPYWYHRIELRPGIWTNGWAPIDATKYGIPSDLTGKTVLDVGAWDGYWTFESVRRGASFVTAIDDFSDDCGINTKADRSTQWATFDLCQSVIDPAKERCNRYHLNVYDVGHLTENDRFDVIFCFGLLYHLRHPLLALEQLRSVCSGTIHIETAILDGCTSAKLYDGSEMSFEFFPKDEFGKNASNWWVGTLKAWCGLVEAAGFKNIESWKLTDNPTCLKDVRGFIRATV